MRKPIDAMPSPVAVTVTLSLTSRRGDTTCVTRGTLDPAARTKTTIGAVDPGCRFTSMADALIVTRPAMGAFAGIVMLAVTMTSRCVPENVVVIVVSSRVGQVSSPVTCSVMLLTPSGCVTWTRTDIGITLDTLSLGSGASMTTFGPVTRFTRRRVVSALPEASVAMAMMTRLSTVLSIGVTALR